MLRGLLDAFSITNCGGQTAPHWHGDRSACSDAHVGSVSTECMIITMLRRGGVLRGSRSRAGVHVRECVAQGHDAALLPRAYTPSE